MAWYERQWADSVDFKDELIELLDASKFGTKEYTPYEVYTKALYEYFKEELGENAPELGRSAVDLAEFQEDAVKKARRILARYDGVLIADSVGLGKTWIGKKLLEDFAYHRRQKAVVVCPASLREMWQRELASATIAAQVVGMEELGRDTFDASPYGDADVILIDESHNFRNDKANRYLALDTMIQLQRRPRAGRRTQEGDPAVGHADQQRPVRPGEPGPAVHAEPARLLPRGRHRRLQRLLPPGPAHGPARRTLPAGVVLFNLLEEVMVRNTRPYIRAAYPNATIKGKPVAFPNRRLHTVEYDLGATYGGLYDEIVAAIDSLSLAPYKLEAYKKKSAIADEEQHKFEEGREEGLVGIFKTRFLKRLESSIEAFRLSLRRALDVRGNVQGLPAGQEGRLVEGFSEGDALPGPGRGGRHRRRQRGRRTGRRGRGEGVHREPADRRSQPVRTAEADARRGSRREAAQEPLRTDGGAGCEGRQAGAAEGTAGRRAEGQEGADLQHVQGHDPLPAPAADRGRQVAQGGGQPAHPPHRQRQPSRRAGPHPRPVRPGCQRRRQRRRTRQIDILISTDVLSEGQNLQDCGVIINYDLTWNPIRLVQRNGRIDRIGSPHAEIGIYNLFPEEELEALLHLIERLTDRISTIDDLGLLDASVLGEVVHPRTFNTLRRIRDEDGAVLDEEEARAELAGPEMLLKQLKDLLNRDGARCPDGAAQRHPFRPAAGEVLRHVLLLPGPALGGEGKRHFWRYIDARTHEIKENRYEIAQLISCLPDEPRYIGDQDVFVLQDKVIEHILAADREAEARAAAPTAVDPIQQTVSEEIKDAIRRRTVDREKAKACISFLGQPMGRALHAKLKAAHESWKALRDDAVLVEDVVGLSEQFGKQAGDAPTLRRLRREDLELICFEYVSA